MPQKKKTTIGKPLRNYDRRPERPQGIRLKARVKANPHEEAQFIPVFSVAFKDDHLFYGKSYDVFITHYLEVRYGDKPILYHEDVGLYQDILFSAEHGEAFYISDLAKRRGITRETLLYRLDRLEDARLIRRVRCNDQPGHPIHVIILAPYEPWHMEQEGPELLRRVHDQPTKKRREELGKHNWPELKWDLDTMLAALEGKDLNRQLKNMITAIEYVSWAATAAGERPSQQEFIQRVKAHCAEQDFTYSAKLLITADCVRRINQKEK